MVFEEILFKTERQLSNYDYFLLQQLINSDKMKNLVNLYKINTYRMYQGAIVFIILELF